MWVVDQPATKNEESNTWEATLTNEDHGRFANVTFGAQTLCQDGANRRLAAMAEACNQVDELVEAEAEAEKKAKKGSGFLRGGRAA